RRVHHATRREREHAEEADADHDRRDEQRRPPTVTRPCRDDTGDGRERPDGRDRDDECEALTEAVSDGLDVRRTSTLIPHEYRRSITNTAAIHMIIPNTATEPIGTSGATSTFTSAPYATAATTVMKNATSDASRKINRSTSRLRRDWANASAKNSV